MALNPDEMAVKNCSKGYPIYKAVVIDPVTGTETSSREITQQEYLNSGDGLTAGCPPVGGGNFIQPRYPFLNGRAFFAQLAKNTKQLRGNDQMLAQMTDLSKYRYMMLNDLLNRNVVVLDPNNMYEIVAKWSKENPHYKTPSSDVLIATFQPQKAVFKATYANRDNTGANYVPKAAASDGGSGGGGSSMGIDTSWIGGLVDLIGGIAAGINNTNVDGIVSTMGSQYVTRLSRFVADVQSAVSQGGNAEGLRLWNSYNRGVKVGMDAEINNLCLEKGKDVPEGVKQARIQWDNLGAELNRLSGGSGSGGNNNTAPIYGTGGNVSGWLKDNWYYVAGAVVVVVLIVWLAKRK